MKNINSRILLIALFQFSFSAFSQDSLAMKSYDINSEPPTPTPFVNNNESDFKIHSILESRPELTQDSKNKMIEFLDKAYSGKGDKTSGEVTIKFVCTKEGTAHSMTINKEKYVCWCSKVTESDIITAIERGASSAKEVISLTGAMRNCDCKNKNPRGT